MPEPTPTLTAEQREEIAEALCAAYDCMECEGTGRAATYWDADGIPTFETCPVGSRKADALTPIVARMVADAAQVPPAADQGASDV